MVNLLPRFVLLYLFVVVLFHQSVWCLNYTKYRKVGDLRLSRIQKHVDILNKPPVFSIQSPDGDIIDCIHKRKQPALDHPLLRNHKIQRVPPEMPMVRSSVSKQEDGGSKSANISQSDGYIRRGAWQMWHRNGERCPKGTVPVRRSKVHDVLRANSLYDFGKKRRRMAPLARRADAPDVVSGNGHEVLSSIFISIILKDMDVAMKYKTIPLLRSTVRNGAESGFTAVAFGQAGFLGTGGLVDQELFTLSDFAGIEGVLILPNENFQ